MSRAGEPFWHPSPTSKSRTRGFGATRRRSQRLLYLLSVYSSYSYPRRGREAKASAILRVGSTNARLGINVTNAPPATSIRNTPNSKLLLRVNCTILDSGLSDPETALWGHSLPSDSSRVFSVG
ncbi:hypothetical protein MRB53_040944 [Persea americana]|nr:hypothetical protein MRB53_040944 [Persea americana]